MSAPRIAGVRVRQALIKGVPRPLLATTLGAPKGAEGQLRPLEPFSTALTLGPSPGPPVDGVLSRAARRVAPPACIGRRVENVVGVRDAGAAPACDVLVVLRATPLPLPACVGPGLAVAPTQGDEQP